MRNKYKVTIKKTPKYKVTLKKPDAPRKIIRKNVA